MTTKVSANLDSDLVAFLEHYQRKLGLKTRSEALEDAIRELRRSQLRLEYALAARDADLQADVRVWDSTAADGLDERY
jgi:Arc/MetJ family transcription regulator